MVTKTEKNKVCKLLSFKKGTKIDFSFVFKDPDFTGDWRT